MFKNLKIGVRLTLSFILMAMISVAVIVYITYKKSDTTLTTESFNRLTAVREMKASQIEDYFKEIDGQAITLSADPTIVKAMSELKNGFNNIYNETIKSEEEFNLEYKEVTNYYNKEYLPRLNKNLNVPAGINSELSELKESSILQYLYIVKNPQPFGEKLNFNFANDGSSYSMAHSKYHTFIKDYLLEFGYYDIFLIDHETGNIVYSVYKEVDFATSLVNGPFNGTNIASSFKASKSADSVNFISTVDFQPYHPSYNAHASFISSPIYDGEEKIGVLCFQMPIDRINKIMTSNENWKDVGLGASGETYIVGENYTLRNQSRFLIEDSLNYFRMIKQIGTPLEIVKKIENQNTTIGLQEVKTKGTKAALNGETGTQIFDDYRGVSVLSAYKPLKIKGLNWVIMSEIDAEEAFTPIYELEAYILSVFVIMLLLIVTLSYVISRRITKPLKHLSGGEKQLAKGNMDAVIDVYGKDEIGLLALSFRKMQVSIKNLVNDLKDINQNLENKVSERTQEIEQQKDILKEKNQEIIDSINYAKRIQSAILPPDKRFQKYFKEYFVLYKPKDIVAGDFYWLRKAKDRILFAAADCTGHGVPGAMVSVVCNNALNRSVHEHQLSEPGEVLTKTREIVVQEFTKAEEEMKDGMDIALCSLPIEMGKEQVNFQYAGAHNPLWIIRKNAEEVEEYKANKQPIGQFDNPVPYITHNILLNKGDIIYIFSDGYVDQFGGKKNKKFKSLNFKKLLISIQQETMEQQKILIDRAFEDWRGQFEQIDDVCVIGVRV